MPYIANHRDKLLPGSQYGADNPGELNYQITELLKQYINRQGLSYQTINDIVGALEGAKLEFYSRIATPYERQKAYDNGDIYT